MLSTIVKMQIICHVNRPMGTKVIRRVKRAPNRMGVAERDNALCAAVMPIFSSRRLSGAPNVPDGFVQHHR